MQKTKISSLVWVALISVPIGWSISRLIQNATSSLPPVPVVLPVLVVLLAALMFIAAREVRGWVHERRHDRHIGPLRVARLLALAKAAEFFGPAVTGGYLGLAILSLDHLSVPMGRDRLLMALLVAGSAILVTVSAFVLERSCVVPPPDDEQQHDGDH